MLDVVKNLRERFYGFLSTLFVWNRERESSIGLRPDTAPEVQYSEAVPASKHSVTDTTEGRGDHLFHFRSAILDHLDDYFYYLKKMRASDKDAYDLMGRIGLNIMPRHAEVACKLRDVSMPYHPAFGGALLSYDWIENERDTIYAKFIYFRKISAPIHRNSSLYEVTLFYTADRNDAPSIAKKYGLPATFKIILTANNEIVVLKERTRRSIYGRNGSFEIPSMNDDYPWILSDIAKKHGKTVQGVAEELFSIVMSSQEHSALANTRIMVRKGELAATFNIDIKRTAYFFRDRDIVLNDKGNKKRIFHIVRAHRRRVGGGTKAIKFHFRGLRQFAWSGYSIIITVPGLHHLPLNELTFASLDAKKMDPIPSGFMTNRAAGRLIAEKLAS